MPDRTRSSRRSFAFTLLTLTLLAAPVVAADGPASRPASSAGPRDDGRAAVREGVDQSMLTDELLGKRPPASTPADRARNLMDESARRLSVDADAGKGTQYVQEQIINELDILIKKAEQQRFRSRNGPEEREIPKQDDSPTPKPDSGPLAKPKPKAETSKGEVGGATPGGGDAPPATGVGEDFRQKAEAWGKVSPRLVGPMIEGRTERVNEKYRGLVDDYYRAVAIKATE